MLDPYLTPALEAFTNVTLNLPDAALDIAWGWRDYTGEGIRFAFFRTYEELTNLAITLHEERARTSPLTTAQRLLGEYHAAYIDLQAVCLGVSDETAAQPPSASDTSQLNASPEEEEWPARTALAHIVGADMGFYGVITFALEKHRAGIWSPDTKIADPDWDRIIGLNEAEYEEFLDGPFSKLQTGHREWHERILRNFSDITDDELEKPSRYWEKETLPLRFRLGRFASHMRQHTIQIEKTLTEISGPPSESRRLIRMLYAALAGVGAATLSANSLGQAARQALAQTITTRAAEIAEALVSETVH